MSTKTTATDPYENECPICCFGMEERPRDGGSTPPPSARTGPDEFTDCELGPLAPMAGAGAGDLSDGGVYECPNGHRYHAECFLRNAQYRARAGRRPECPTCRTGIPAPDLAELGFRPDPGGRAGAAGGETAGEQVPRHKTVMAVAMASCAAVLCTYVAIGVVTEEFTAV